MTAPKLPYHTASLNPAHLAMRGRVLQMFYPFPHNQTGIDLEEAFEKKLAIKTKRDHNRHHNNKKLK